MNPSGPLHSIVQLVEAFVLGGIAVAALLFFRNRVIRRRMVFTSVLVGVVIGWHFGVDAGVLARTAGAALFEKLLVAFAAVNTAVTLLFNPWFSDRVRDRAPAIVQDALVIGLFLAIGLIFFQEDATKLIATSAIAAAVLGLALQETLGNAFAGLAIQTEKPFRVGHWVAVASYVGRVTEVTWRATKIRTKDGNLVTLPNNVVAREPINNYTEPAAPTRLFVEVGASYAVPPNEVREALVAAARRAPFVLETPGPDVILWEFAASAITYRVRFWINDFEHDDAAKDGVRRGIYYEFSRRDIEIPFPIQTEISKEEVREAPDQRIERYSQIIGSVPVLAALFVEGRRALAETAAERLFGDGEVIVHEGDPAGSMYIVCRGQVVVTIGKGHEVARIGKGGYFGEMSLVTGEPRSATVVASGDCSVLEISADTFKAYVTAHPDVIEYLAAAAADRRRELDESRAAAAAPSVEARRTLAGRMRKFFGLD